MILLAVFLAATEPAPLSLEPFMDEDAAGRAMERHLNCLGGGAFDRREEKRDPKDIAADVVSACSRKAAKLREALVDVYRRKPQLLPVGKGPNDAADFYVNEMNGRVESVIREGQTTNSHAKD